MDEGEEALYEWLEESPNSEEGMHLKCSVIAERIREKKKSH